MSEMPKSADRLRKGWKAVPRRASAVPAKPADSVEARLKLVALSSHCFFYLCTRGAMVPTIDPPQAVVAFARATRAPRLMAPTTRNVCEEGWISTVQRATSTPKPMARRLSKPAPASS